MAFILLVDDDQQVHLVVTAVLSAKGHDLISASDGKEALSHLKKNEFDLLILDYTMPGMSGIEVYKIAKAEFSHQLPPVLMLTGHNDAESIQECLQAGVAGYLLKPFKMNDLAQRVEKILIS